MLVTPLPRRAMVARLAVAVSIVLMAGSLTGASFGSRLAPTGVCGGGDTVVVINQMLQTRRPSRISVTKSVSLKANTKYSVTLHSWDDHPDREPQSNERWHIQLLSNGKTVYTSSDTPDISNTAETAKWNGTATFSGAPDTLVAIHPGGTPSGEDGDSVWAVCAVFKELKPPTTDTVPPVITLNGTNPTRVRLGGSYIERATATDNVDGPITGKLDIDGSVNTLIVGTYTLTYNVKDDADNKAATKTRKVVVFKPPTTDTVPVITLIGPDLVKVALNSEYQDWGAIALDGDVVITGEIVPSGLPVDSSILGPHRVTYNVEDATGNKAAPKTRTVIVERVPPPDSRPEIHPTGDNVIEVPKESEYADAHAKASDREDGDITSDIVAVNPVDTAELGTYIVTYDVEDSSGQFADQRTRTVHVVDKPGPSGPDLRPVITPIGPNTVEVNQHSVYEDPGASAIDAEDGDVTANIVTDDPVDTATPGKYTVTYTVVDSAGQSADKRTRTVSVIEEKPAGEQTEEEPPAVLVALTDDEDGSPLSRGDELTYTVRFANFGPEAVTVTATLELPLEVSPEAGTACEGSVCTTEMIIPPVGEIVPPIDELPSWSIVVVVDTDDATAVVATVTVEGDEIAGLQDQEPTLLGSDR